MNTLKGLLDMDGIDYTETSFETDEGVNGLDDSKLFVSGRPYILANLC